MSALWWYKLLFMTELLAAEALFTFRLQKRGYFALRAALVVAVCYAVAALYPLPTKVSYSGWYASLMFLVLFATTFCALLFVYKISAVKLLFCGITAYTVQHLSYELFALLSNVFSFGGMDMYDSGILDFSTLNSGTVIAALVYFDLYVIVYGVSYWIMGKRFNAYADVDLNVALLLFVAAILLIDIVLNAFTVYINAYSKDYELIVCVYNILCCMLAFYIQASMLKVKDMKMEMQSVSDMLRQSQRQYKLQKENIDLINLKCHDLRYQISRLTSGKAIDDEELGKISDAISIYDATVKTGNEVLDIILTEKSLICREKGITLTCMADCGAFEFMREGELYALFGNIVDNAIEAVSKLDDVQKRCISLNVRNAGAMISVKAENYYAGEIKFSADGLPLTDKKDKDFHGYGMLSIQTLVHKYGGNMSVAANDGIFRLNIMFPSTGN